MAQNESPGRTVHDDDVVAGVFEACGATGLSSTAGEADAAAPTGAGVVARGVGRAAVAARPGVAARRGGQTTALRSGRKPGAVSASDAARRGGSRSTRVANPA